MIRVYIICLLFAWSAVVTSAKAQVSNTYDEAYRELKGMLTDSIEIDFKRAVFVTENAYAGGGLSYASYNENIRFLTSLCKNIAEQNPIIYSEADKAEVNKYAAVYRLMTDTVRFDVNDSSWFQTKPFEYDFDDFWGERRWEQMFVTKLLDTHSGNCHSLPFLYKILCEELGTKAYLAMAPNHLYIKQWTKKTGWFNTELTSRTFPIDAWIMASGYVHLSAVQNRVYMDTLSQKQTIALCLIDLAKGYERRHPANLDFLERSTELALRYYPNYVNALILKAETTKRQFEKIIKDRNAEYPSDVFDDAKAKALFTDMEGQYLSIHQIGYRMMPKDMYLNWLSDLKRHKSKFQNKEANSTLTQFEK